MLVAAFPRSEVELLRAKYLLRDLHDVEQLLKTWLQFIGYCEERTHHVVDVLALERELREPKRILLGSEARSVPILIVAIALLELLALGLFNAASPHERLVSEKAFLKDTCW